MYVERIGYVRVCMHRQVREEEEEEEEYHRASAQQRRAISGYFSPSCASRRRRQQQQHTAKAAALHRVRLVNFCLLLLPPVEKYKTRRASERVCPAGRVLLVSADALGGLGGSGGGSGDCCSRGEALGAFQPMNDDP